METSTSRKQRVKKEAAKKAGVLKPSFFWAKSLILYEFITYLDVRKSSTLSALEAFQFVANL